MAIYISAPCCTMVWLQPKKLLNDHRRLTQNGTFPISYIQIILGVFLMCGGGVVGSVFVCRSECPRFDLANRAGFCRTLRYSEVSEATLKTNKGREDRCWHPCLNCCNGLETWKALTLLLKRQIDVVEHRLLKYAAGAELEPTLILKFYSRRFRLPSETKNKDKPSQRGRNLEGENWM